MSPIKIINHCSQKGKEVELWSEEAKPNLFTADFCKFIYRFRYREVDHLIFVPYKGEGCKKFWSKLLRYVRKEKAVTDDLYENGLEEDFWERDPVRRVA